MLLVWGALFGGAYFLRTRNALGALIIGLLVVSHWPLDWIVHRPDMPLYPGGPKFGLGVWNSIPLTLTLELGLYPFIPGDTFKLYIAAAALPAAWRLTGRRR